jgi:crossover junction endodeoxyribonuclease RuvC
MRVLGIDPGSHATGFGVVDRRDGHVVHVTHGTLRVPRTAALPERLALLYAGLADVLRDHRPDHAVVEQVFVSHSARSALVLGQARGAALAALGAAGIPVSELSAREVKKAVVGTGAASKPQVQAMVARILSLDARPRVDAADALAAAICRAHAGPLADLGPRRRRTGRRLGAPPLANPVRRAP